ncbi:DUF2075 domain-containing protein [Niallia taxi]|uniref:DNA/RNA helicase domain-containing protein n=1 Tax=Niallia taxi TaxID=2499688 RepID=UPI00203F4D95|nr:DNA/RNA helicase domain-containing protein [Niallia taxi]MCM3217755.1 DUF2075 domain-containing protein [Niallia taxi]
MNKKYNTKIIDLNTDGTLNTTRLSRLEEETLLQNRDIIYVYIGDKHCYIGQTKQLLKRHKQHSGSNEPNFIMSKFKKLVILYGQLVDKNLDYLEKRLITLFITDNTKHKRKIEIDNKNNGNLSNHQQDSKELDALVITPFWQDDLFELGCLNNRNVSYLKRRILAKYSPFMDLKPEQQQMITRILNEGGNFLFEGGSGTGKTVLMTNTVAQLFDKYNGEKKIGVVVKANWRQNAIRIFTDYGISKNVTVGTWGMLLNTEEKFDYIIVDEAHRLPRFYGKLHPSERKYFKGDKTKTSLELLSNITSSLILFYDRYQSIRPSDIPTYIYDEYVKQKEFKVIPLVTQFRIDIHDKQKTYTADDYIKGIRYLLQISDDDSFDKSLFTNSDPDSYFGVSNSIEELFIYLNRMDNLISDSQNRVIAGYAREWVSKTDKNCYDWIEGTNQWQWNSSHEDWMNKKNSREEIGSIHAVQGVDINCVGLIIGKDLTFRNGKVMASKENYFDKNGKPVQSEFTESEFTTFIKNIYYTLMTRGIDGIRIYIEDSHLKQYLLDTINA